MEDDIDRRSQSRERRPNDRGTSPVAPPKPSYAVRGWPRPDGAFEGPRIRLGRGTAVRPTHPPAVVRGVGDCGIERTSARAAGRAPLPRDGGGPPTKSALSALARLGRVDPRGDDPLVRPRGTPRGAPPPQLSAPGIRSRAVREPARPSRERAVPP